MQLMLTTLDEDLPGAQWLAHAAAFWPGYQSWWQRDGERARPTFLACRKALREHMPELLPTWSTMCDLLGGGDVPARFLSMWCPPPYIVGCTQAVWSGQDASEARLLRNYDFSPALFDGCFMATRWCGQRVLAMSDCLWGALDGINESGLCASLSFGGRTVTGLGFGIPLVMRYVLEQAQSVAQAVAILQRLPHHMSYNVSLLDKTGQWATVFVAPDRATEVVPQRSVSNIQHAVEWVQHANATHALLRAQSLAQALAEARDADDVLQRLLQTPLWQSAFARGYGTLYTASYDPGLGQVQLHWPQQDPWVLPVAQPLSGQRQLNYSTDPAPDFSAVQSQQRWHLDTPRIGNSTARAEI